MIKNRIIGTALALAADGYPVFPCAASTKCPTTPHGFKDASADSVVIKQLWRDHPGGLIGVPTGTVSGFDVLDLDAKHDEAKTWWHRNRHRLPQTRTHRTRSDGAHLLFQHNDTMRCSAGKIARGVDTRADGGYIVWWPATGFPVLADAPLALWPNFLLEEFRPKPQSLKATPNPSTFHGDGWLRGLVRTVTSSTEGQRNQILFWAACRAGEAVRDGKADEAFITDVLVEAAARAGLPEREAQRTIKSGMGRS